MGRITRARLHRQRTRPHFVCATCGQRRSDKHFRTAANGFRLPDCYDCYVEQRDKRKAITNELDQGYRHHMTNND